jgi:pyruvate dehydrogenase E2 component (dihydrolipoamide acetyltransferase)
LEIVKMPRLGVTMQEGIVAHWLKDEGEEIKAGEDLFEIESEKFTTVIEAQASGILGKIFVEGGTKVKTGEALAVIVEKGEKVDYEEIRRSVSSVKEEPKAERKKEKATFADEEKVDSVRAVPKARKYARDRGINLSEITGTGPDGIITLDDVKKAETREDSVLAIREIKPLNLVMKAMKDNIYRSWEEIPQFTQILEVNAENLLNLKDKQKVSINALMVKAISDAVKENMIINSTLDGDEIVVYDNINVGIAVARGDSLFVPVIKNTETKTQGVIDEEIKAIVSKENLEQEDLSGGTITFSNLGRYGIRRGVSIINYPQCCLVFMGDIYNRLDVDEKGGTIVRKVFELSITFDHRYITGMTAAEFSQDLKILLETMS